MSGAREGEWHEWPFEPLPVLSALGEHRVEYVLIGGLAAVLQGSPLPTYDIDIAPAPGTANARRLASALADVQAAALTNADDAQQALQRHTDMGFSTPFGYVDLRYRACRLRHVRSAAPQRHTNPARARAHRSRFATRDIIRSRTAAGDHRQLPALEATLELTRTAARNEDPVDPGSGLLRSTRPSLPRL